MFRYLACFALATLLCSCQEPVVVTTLNVALTGSRETDTLMVSRGPFVQKVPLISGTARTKLETSGPGLYMFSLPGHWLTTHLIPGDSLALSGEARSLTATAVFSGPQQRTWAYYQKKEAVSAAHQNMNTLLAMDSTAFRIAFRAADARLRELLDSADLVPEVISFERESMDYRNRLLLYRYPEYNDLDAKDVPGWMQDPLADTDLLNDDRYEFNAAYERLVNTVFWARIQEDTTAANLEEAFRKSIAALPDGKVRNDLLHRYIQRFVGAYDQIDEQMEFYLAYATDTLLIRGMTKTAVALRALQKGQPSPTFNYENHKGGTTGLESLRGKFVYIDVWATWCGPCIGEIPSLQEKEERYRDANVEFVSLSIDDPEERDEWRAMVEKLKLGGTQLMADKAWDADFIAAYRISSIPHFLLIDPEGNIVSADAPRPSEERFDELFAEEGLK